MKGSKYWRVLCIGTILVVASLGVASCQPKAATTAGTVYYLAPVLSDEYQVGSQLFIEKYGQEKGYTVKTLMANNNATTQISQMEDAMAQKPLAIILNAVDANMIAATVEKARAEGIIVEAYDRPIPTGTVDLTTSASTVIMGRVAGERIVLFLQKKNGAAKGVVLEIVGDPADYNAVYMDQGFMEIMTQYPDIEVIRRDAQGWETTSASSVLDDQLTARGDEIEALFAHLDAWMPAMANVLQAHGYTVGDPRLFIIGQGGTPTGLESIRSGWLQEIVDYPMSPEYKSMFDYLDELKAGTKIVAGTYVVDGFTNEVRIDDWGPTVWVGAEVISKAGGDGTLSVDDPSLWGNVKVPAQ